MEGFYVMYYTGVSGFGHALLIFKNGAICGADANGGVYDGAYEPDGDSYRFDVVYSSPAGASLVTGQSLTDEHRQTISGVLRDSFANGQPVPIETPLGPVNVNFKKLRDLP